MPPTTAQPPSTSEARPQTESPERAAERRLAASRQLRRNDPLGVQATSVRALALALARPCPRHGAPPGVGCWEIAPDAALRTKAGVGDYLLPRPHRALCGNRIERAKAAAK